MRNLILTTLLALAAAQTFAMPTKAELKKAQPLVVELMAPAMEKYKSAPYKEKAAAAAKVGDASAEFAKAAETEAAKFLLLKGAVSFYARGEQYDKAAETVTTLQREIKDVPPAVIAEITGKATGRISETKAPALYALYRTAKLQVRASEEAKALAAKLKKTPSDALQRKYAEALAVSGDWKSAYAEFAKVKNAKLQAIVKDESSGSAKNADAGEFWWSYEPAMEDTEEFFKSHAAAFYRRALEAGEITGLKKNLIEQRIKGIPVGEASCLPMVRQDAAPTSMRVTNGKYDIVTGGKSPFEEKDGTLIMKLENGKTVVFIKCPAGEVQLLTDYEKDEVHKVKITRPYWIMRVPFGSRDKLNGIPYFEIGKDWCWNKTELGFHQLEKFCSDYTKDLSKYLPKGYVLRLPSLAEIEHAYHAGNYEKWDIYGNVFRGHSEDELKKSMNSWGIGYFTYREKVLDRIMPSTIKLRENDREGGVSSIAALPLSDDFFTWNDGDCKYRLRRNFRDKKLECISIEKDGGDWVGHQRLVIGPDLVSEWKAKHGASSVASSLPATGSAKSAMVRQDAAPTSSGKAWQEKGNTAWLTLPNGEKLEFAKCPAGTAPILYHWKGESLFFRANVTRPYWIMKTPLQAKDTKGLSGPFDLQGRDNWELKREKIDMFCETLTDEFKNALPKDYVIRLPSLAECQYAYTEGGKAKTPPYDSLTKYGYGDKLYGEIGIQEQSRANGWGISHWHNLHKILDCLTDENCVFDEKRRVVSLSKPNDQNDPLWWGRVPNDADDFHDGQTDVSIRVQFRPQAERKTFGVSRLVVGPDLVSEWRARDGKK